MDKSSSVTDHLFCDPVDELRLELPYHKGESVWPVRLGDGQVLG